MYKLQSMRIWRLVIFLWCILLPVASPETDTTDTANGVIADFQDYDTEALLEWDSPEELQNDYPYYLSGFDDENSPIWIAEMGKWDTRKSTESGPERERNFRKYMLQFLKRCQESIKLRSTPDYPVKEFNLIVDMEGFTVRQTATLPALNMALWMAKQFEQAFRNHVKYAYIVNGNFVFTSLWNIMKPILGQNVYKVEIFGSNKDRFIPRLLKIFPKEELPEWYGGTTSHKPVQAFG